MRFKVKWIILFIILCPKISFTQNLTSSPYSVFGIGEICSKGSSSNLAMGGAGIGLKSTIGLNNINPASYSGIDSLFFIYEIGIISEYSKFSTEKANQNQFVGNLSRIAIGFQANNKWSMSIGLNPFSNVGYNISSTNNMENDNSVYEDTYIGSGGINQIYWGNSVKLLKNVSLGINISYLFGSIEEEEDISFQDNITDYKIISENHTKGLYLDYGIQIDLPTNGYNWTLGAIYGHKRYLNSSADKTIYDINSSILQELKDIDSDEEYIIPRKIGIGLSVSKNDFLKLAFDYTLNQWSEIEFSNSELKTKDSHGFSLGLEYSPEGRYSNNLLKSWYYRIGGNYNSSYLKINNNSINSMALTFGLGIPVKRNLSMLNISFEVGKNGTLNNNLIEERFYTLNLNFSLQDIWFMKTKYN